MRMDEVFGEPHDAYVNGSQVWLREDGPGEMTLEWRLHPVARYERPKGVETYDVFPTTAMRLQAGETVNPAVEALWDGLEVFSAYGEEIEPATLARIGFEVLGIAADASGLVDHESIADRWMNNGRTTSIVNDLLSQLTA
jgi:hypothetical protein